jgi:hypothetical protein
MVRIALPVDLDVLVTSDGNRVQASYLLNSQLVSVHVVNKGGRQTLNSLRVVLYANTLLQFVYEYHLS